MNKSTVKSLKAKIPSAKEKFALQDQLKSIFSGIVEEGINSSTEELLKAISKKLCLFDLIEKDWNKLCKLIENQELEIYSSCTYDVYRRLNDNLASYRSIDISAFHIKAKTRKDILPFDIDKKIESLTRKLEALAQNGNRGEEFRNISAAIQLLKGPILECNSELYFFEETRLYHDEAWGSVIYREKKKELKRLMDIFNRLV
jgi:hypothetical protein